MTSVARWWAYVLGCRRNEAGSLAPAMPVIALMLFLLGGLGVDGSRQLNARGQATAFAEEAARAGAQAVDLANPILNLDFQQARRRVDDYCARVERLDQVQTCEFVRFDEVSPGKDTRLLIVVTRVRMKINTTLLGMAGVHSLSASAEAKARPFEGIIYLEQ